MRLMSEHLEPLQRLLLAVLDWRSIFLVKVPICLWVIWLALEIDTQTSGMFVEDPHRIAAGTRIAATISTASSALIMLIIWHFCRQRDRTPGNELAHRRLLGHPPAKQHDRSTEHRRND
jgi:hypothetical protein